MTYTHLTQEERYQIYALKRAGITQKVIARILMRSESTISREISRNSGLRGYRPKQAHHKSQIRRAVNARTITTEDWQWAQSKLLEQWSPEQISAFVDISHETIYQRVYQDKEQHGILWKCLRCQKKYKKRYGVLERRGTIPNRLSIEERPIVANDRSRIGDWEGDTIIGKSHKQALVSIVERQSKLTLIHKVTRKTADAVSDAMVELLKPHKNKVLTITVDNGREFAGHQEIAQQLEANVYFAHPYASWERGTNENTNGLIRQYFPKQRDFSTITQEEINMVMDRLNNRPRKTLGYKTPNQVFFNSGIALQT
jgi:IS30 family transposase